MTTESLRVAVVVATLGRPQEVGQLLERLAIQSLLPVVIVLSVESETDLPPDLPPDVQVILGSRGSSVQRNRGTDFVLENFGAAPAVETDAPGSPRPKGLTIQRNRGIETVMDGCDVIAFFDDDYLPAQNALSEISALFQEHPEVVGATGLVLADGIGRGGIDYDAAMAILANFDRAPPPVPTKIKHDVPGAYGCNMAFRVSAIKDVRFDEQLPLYGWQEDVDFAARLLPYGRVVKTDVFAGVHRGVTRGRTSGVRLGYSQIVNPIYLLRKGTMRSGHVIKIMTRNFIANHFRALWPEPWIDRRGRARGNWLGIIDVIKGRAHPTRVLEIH